VASKTAEEKALLQNRLDELRQKAAELQDRKQQLIESSETESDGAVGPEEQEDAAGGDAAPCGSEDLGEQDVDVETEASDFVPPPLMSYPSESVRHKKTEREREREGKRSCTFDCVCVCV